MKLTKKITPIINTKKNKALLWEITKEENEETMKAMHPNKTLTHDVFSVEFLQLQWSRIGGDVWREIEECWREKLF